MLTILISTITTFCAKAKDWKEYKINECHCSVLMPIEPQLDKKTIPSDLGNLDFYILMAATDGTTDSNLVYGLSYNVYPMDEIRFDSVDKLNGILDGARDGAIKNVGGKLLSEKKIMYHEYTGREINVDFKEGMAIIKMRFYLIKNRLFTIQVITLPANSPNLSINKFFDSLKIDTK